MLDRVDASELVRGSIGDSPPRRGGRASRTDFSGIAPQVRARASHDLSGCEGASRPDHRSSQLFRAPLHCGDDGRGGATLFDCDNSGRLDIAAVNNSTIERFLAGGDPMITLYRQDGSGGALHFTDVTAASGLTTRGWGMAIAVADFDNDGLPDLYVTGYGHNVLYHNLGGCNRAARPSQT